MHTPGRPHRASKILYIPPAITPVTLDQLRLVADQLIKTRRSQEAKTKVKAGPKVAQSSPAERVRGPVEPTDEAERAKRIDRARSYLDKVPHAISGIYNENGQKGHDATFTGLGKVIRRFAADQGNGRRGDRRLEQPVRAAVVRRGIGAQTRQHLRRWPRCRRLGITT